LKRLLLLLPLLTAKQLLIFQQLVFFLLILRDSSFPNHFLLLTFVATPTIPQFLSNFFSFFCNIPDKLLQAEKINTTQQAGTENEPTTREEK
jgi:hypothetical protein